MRETQADEDVVHGELADTAAQCLTLLSAGLLGQTVQFPDYKKGVLHPSAYMGGSLLMRDSGTAYPIIIRYCRGNGETPSPQQQLRREKLVFVQDTRQETQVTQDATTEKITTGRRTHVTCQQEIRSATEQLYFWDRSFSPGMLMGKAEQQYIGLEASLLLQDMTVGLGQKEIVSIQKLDIFALRHI